MVERKNNEAKQASWMKRRSITVTETIKRNVAK